MSNSWKVFCPQRFRRNTKNSLPKIPSEFVGKLFFVCSLNESQSFLPQICYPLESEHCTNLRSNKKYQF